MYYICFNQNPVYRQIGFNDLFFSDECKSSLITNNYTNTRTVVRSEIKRNLYDCANPSNLIFLLKEFNKKYAYLRDVNRKRLYCTFYRPKSKGGYRRIDAPKDELMKALHELKELFEEKFQNFPIPGGEQPHYSRLYHTSCFAYTKKRAPKDVAVRHQQNESKWFLKLDLENFFGSTTIDFVIKQFKTIYPFCLVLENETGKEEFTKAIELAFLNGVLPQGTPISPMITNIMMIPIDHRFYNDLRNFDNKRFVYTRYADDFQISCKYEFSYTKIINYMNDVLKEFGAPFSFRKDKTKYGSSSGSNWILGVMLNSENKITIGYKNKRRFESALANYARDKKNGTPWEKNDVQILEGHRSYYTSIEGENIDKIIEHIGIKFGIDIRKEIASDLAS